MKRAALMIAAAAATSPLAGCGQEDDPANTPRLGTWEVSRMASGLAKNGTGVSRNDFQRAYVASGAMPARSRTECTEPKLADPQWLARYIGSQVDRTCRITESTQSASAAQGKGVCGEVRHGTSGPNETSFHYYADVAADSFKASAQISIRTDKPSGASDVMSMNVKIEGERKGDC